MRSAAGVIPCSCLMICASSADSKPIAHDGSSGVLICCHCSIHILVRWVASVDGIVGAYECTATNQDSVHCLVRGGGNLGEVAVVIVPDAAVYMCRVHKLFPLVPSSTRTMRGPPYSPPSPDKRKHHRHIACTHHLVTRHVIPHIRDPYCP